MSRIYEVRSEDDGFTWGARRTRPEALVAEMEAQAGEPGFGLRRPLTIVEIEIDTTGLFEIPPRPTPRDLYATRIEVISDVVHRGVQHARAVHVEILDGDRLVFAYDRNYAMLRTFEPFRQGDRDYALISPDYTATAVADLATGRIVASEQHDPGGFCPVGFYVPDWWDVHERLGTANVLPGSSRWRSEDEWPTGDFGFVWGCRWGDDSTMKVQYLDLSHIREGVVARDDRFGYVELADQPAARAAIAGIPGTSR
jgi:hypothetical protein